jgi:hypothetical protein
MQVAASLAPGCIGAPCRQLLVLIDAAGDNPFLPRPTCHSPRLAAHVVGFAGSSAVNLTIALPATAIGSLAAPWSANLSLTARAVGSVMLSAGSPAAAGRPPGTFLHHPCNFPQHGCCHPCPPLR